MVEAVTGTLSIRYDGPALVNHSMDVRQVAPSLLGLADLLTFAHLAVGDGTTLPPALEMTAQREGSFAVDLWLRAQVDEAVEMLNTQEALALATASGILLPTIGALRWLTLRRRKGLEQRVEPSDAGVTRIWWEDGTLLEAAPGSEALVESMDFNRLAAKVVEPLRRTGINMVELAAPGHPAVTVVIETDDLPIFNILETDDDIVTDNVRTVMVRIVAPAFNPGNKWRIDDGSGAVWVDVADADFLDRVSNSEARFASGDSLLILMRDRQYRTLTGITMKHTIERVIRHDPAIPPTELPFEE